MKDNNYKTALVTGASSGIGYATAKKLSSIGIKVIASARRLQKLKKLQSEISCEIIQLDILDQKNIYRSLKDLEIDILINNAGIGKAFSPIFETNPDDINITTETNITSFLHEAFMRCMLVYDDEAIRCLGNDIGFMELRTSAA